MSADGRYFRHIHSTLWITRCLWHSIKMCVDAYARHARTFRTFSEILHCICACLWCTEKCAWAKDISDQFMLLFVSLDFCNMHYKKYMYCICMKDFRLFALLDYSRCLWHAVRAHFKSIHNSWCIGRCCIHAEKLRCCIHADFSGRFTLADA